MKKKYIIIGTRYNSTGMCCGNIEKEGMTTKEKAYKYFDYLCNIYPCYHIQLYVNKLQAKNLLIEREY